MPKLTSLALKLIDVDVDDKHLNDQLNQCFPNLQVLKLTVSREFKDLNLHLPDLQAFDCLMFSDSLDSLTLITPSLVTLIITCIMPPAIHVEAPVLSYFDLTIYNFKPAETFTIKKFENLKTLSLDTSCIGSLLSEFPITKTVETLALCTRTNTARADSKLTLAKVFTVFPNVSSLSLISGGWSKLEACSKPESWEIFDGRKGLKTIYAYLMLADPLLTFMCIARVLDQCVNLLEVSFGLSYNVSYDTSQTFKSKCMARWPGLKWRWERRSWIPGGISN
ncbi:F-box/LRR-repeat protein At4g29420-like [Bidens hawaiensis]|uniref:F-box/LRR-repeat protein At4g29420-like n=1 Tax=Bidens hawaiensis TaxID=980011 RepID=UPI00404A9FD8